MAKAKKPQGFAAMDPDLRREMASVGGRAAHKLGRAHQWTKETAKMASIKATSARRAKRDLEKARAGQ